MLIRFIVFFLFFSPMYLFAQTTKQDSNGTGTPLPEEKEASGQENLAPTDKVIKPVSSGKSSSETSQSDTKTPTDGNPKTPDQTDAKTSSDTKAPAQTDAKTSADKSSKDVASKKPSKDDIIIKHVDQTTYTDQVDRDGHTDAILTGNVRIFYNDMDIRADQIIIKLSNHKAVSFIAKGNVLLTKGDKITGLQGIFTYIKDKKTILFGGLSLSKNMYIKPEMAKIQGKDLLTLDGVTATTSKHLYPHYLLGSGTGWIDDHKDGLFLNAYFEIGEDPLIYFPIFYNDTYGTGIITSIMHDNYIGYIVNNTYKEEGENYTEKFMFDYYQRLGEYIGNDYTRTDIGTLNTHIGLAYDQHVKYEDGQFTNYFEQVLGEGKSSGRSLRYNVSVDYQNTVYESEDPDGLKLNFSTLYKDTSDPNFVSQFETGRSETFDLAGLLFPGDGDSSRAGSSTGGGTGRQMQNTLSGDFYGYSLSLKTSVAYDLTGDTQGNSFSPDYYNNTLASMTLPEISLMKHYDFGSVSYSLNDETSLSLPVGLDFSYGFTDSGSYLDHKVESQDMNNQLMANITAPLSISWGGGSFNIPFAFNNSINYQNYGAYNTVDDSNLLSSQYSKYIYTGNMQYAPSFTFNFANTSWDLSTTLNTDFSQQGQQSQDADADAISNDNNNSYSDLKQSAGATLKTSWMNDIDYYAGYLTGSYSYDYGIHYGSKLPEEQYSKTRTQNYSVGTSLLKNTLSVNTSDTRGTNILAEDVKQPLSVSLDSNLFPYVNISNNYSFDREAESSINNNLNFAFSIPSRINVWSWLWFSKTDINLSWSHNYQNQTLDYLIYTFSMTFNVTPLWEVNFDLSGRNNALYRYGDQVASSQKKNFFVDLFKSFAFWDTSAREESSFKMDSFGFKVIHDLDEWDLTIGAAFSPQLDSSGMYYFSSDIYFEVVLKDIDSLSAPRIERNSDNQLD